MKKITLKIRRYDPETGKSALEAHPYDMRPDDTVLDALQSVKNEKDGTLSFRWSCRMGICGSCGMMVNGKPVLTCSTYLRDVAGDVVTVEPLRNFPIIKDLIVDIDDPMEKMRSVFPYVTISERVEKKSARQHRQTPKQLEKIAQTGQCIKCMLCYSACPVYGLNKEFVGPAAAALAYRYDQDSRETSKEAKSKRMDRLAAKNGVFDCSFVGECSTVCPKRVDPAISLQRLKMMGVLHLTKSVLKK